MKKNIIIIDDSALMRRVLSDIINETEQYHVAATAHNGEEGMKLMRSMSSIHLVFLDMNMPKMGGLEVLHQMKKENLSIPVVVFSAAMDRDSAETIEALSIGALDFVRKPENILVNVENFRRKIREVFALLEHEPEEMSVVVKAKPRSRTSSAGSLGRGKLVALACSTGGPKALQDVIPFLPKNLDAPMLIVQHMPEGFTESLAHRLDDMSMITVKEAADGDVLENGKVYLAKGGFHMRVVYERGHHVIRLGTDAPVGRLRPYANYMYESLVQSNYNEIICVVLTGMGADGTKGIETLSQEKNIYVISQDKPTCVVYGMPKAIAESGLTDEILPLNKIAQAITKKTGVC